MLLKVILAALLSSVLTIFAQNAHAHEVSPTIADMTQDSDTLTFDLRLNVEAFIADIDLDGLDDINQSDRSDNYDALRALDPAGLEAELRRTWEDIAPSLRVTAGDTPLSLSLTKVTIPPAGNIALPRPSQITATATLPPGTDSVTVDWARGGGTLILRQQGVDAPYTGTLSGGDSTGVIALSGAGARSGWAAFAEYIPVGFDHILPLGLDHILFVLGLFFLSTRFGPLLWQVTAFTAAHTLTLAAAALGWVTVPGSIVEPLIAASIVFVAVDNIFAHGPNRWRPVLIFVFGLLHGLGFASVLAEFGLPENQFIPALLGFNIGVEIGQLTVIAVMFIMTILAQRIDRQEGEPRMAQAAYAALFVGAIAWAVYAGWSPMAPFNLNDVTVFALPIAAVFALCGLSVTFCDRPDGYRHFVAIPASAVIALIGAYWFVERVFL